MVRKDRMGWFGNPENASESVRARGRDDQWAGENVPEAASDITRFGLRVNLSAASFQVETVDKAARTRVATRTAYRDGIFAEPQR